MGAKHAGGGGGDPVKEQFARIQDLLEQARELFRQGEISLAISVRNDAVRLHDELDRAICASRPAWPPDSWKFREVRS